MFHKAHWLFTLLCVGSTSAIMILMSLLYLRVSENSLYDSQFYSFQKDVNTIATNLEETSTLSMQWLARMEAQNDYSIFIIDNGVPFLYNSLRDGMHSHSKALLAESLDAYISLFADAPVANINTYSNIWHTEYAFRSPTEQSHYYCSRIDIGKNNTSTQIMILCSLTVLRAQIIRQRLLFLGIISITIVLLSVFSWLFTGRLLKPLQENYESQMQFIGAASHELRTPLSVILASSECCESATAEEQKSFFQTIRKEGRRMNALINDMLTLAHTGTNRFLIECAPAQLDTLCLNAYEAFEPLCQKKQVLLSLQLPEDSIPRCKCDSARIAQTLSILLHNAVSYTPDGGQISLSLAWDHKEGVFEITVTDTGIGISDADKKHIFERFYRAEKSRSAKGHFGLGLSIAYEIVSAHHGKISAEDNPAGGSIFTVKLPMT